MRAAACVIVLGLTLAACGVLHPVVAVLLRLLECVKTEDKANPLSDEEIARQLMARNYSIARRTVAKYREELKIPSKNFRKVA